MDELGHAEGFHRRRESRMLHRDQLSTLVLVAESEERLEEKVCNRAGVWIGGLNLEEQKEGKDHQLPYLLSWSG